MKKNSYPQIRQNAIKTKTKRQNTIKPIKSLISTYKLQGIKMKDNALEKLRNLLFSEFFKGLKNTVAEHRFQLIMNNQNFQLHVQFTM